MKTLTRLALGLVWLASCVSAEEPAVIRPLKHSDVVFMGAAKKEVYEAYGATVVDWGGHTWKNEPKPIADFRDRVKMAQDLGIQYNAGIGMITEFAGMIDSCPEYEKAICRTIEGQPITVPWLWDHKVHGKLGMAYWFCSNSPLYQDYLRRRTELAMKGEPDGYHIDDYGGTNGSLWKGGCFCESCMEGFRKYLADFFAPSAGRTAGLKAGRLAGLWGKKTANVPPEKLRELGIEKLDDFHYGKFLLGKYVKDNADLMKNRWKMPLDTEYRTFQAKAAGEVVRGLQEYAVSLRGKPLSRCVNGAPPGTQAFVVMPHMDHYSCEIGMNAPNKKFTTGSAFTYKCGDMIHRGIAGTAAGWDWAYAAENNATNLVRYWIAESYALGQCLMTPGTRQWAYTEKKGTHWYAGKPEDFADLYQFVRKNADLFDGYESAAQVGVLFSNPAWRKNKKDAQQAAACLLEANVPFGLVAAGDDLLALRLDEKELAGFEKIVVPADPMLDPAQQEVLKKAEAGGKTVVWKDGPTLLQQITPWVSLEGAKNVWALPRRVPSRADSPLIVHLLNRNYDYATDRTEAQKDLVLHIRRPLIARTTPARCAAYAAGTEPTPLTIEAEPEGVRVKVPELGLWSVLKLE